MKGLIHLYTGDGKGKTTASMGVVLRSLGYGKKVQVIQFLKAPNSTGEAKSFEKFSDIQFGSWGQKSFVVNKKTAIEDREMATEAFQAAEKIVETGRVELLVLDEICVAIYFKLIKEEKVVGMVKIAANKGMNVILTGRKASSHLVEVADLVTEMKLVKHPFNQGVPAREGLDF